MTPITDLNHLLNWINTKRHHDHTTINQLAQTIGTKPSTLGHYLNGKRPIPAKTLIQLLHALGRDLALLNRPNKPGKTP